MPNAVKKIKEEKIDDDWVYLKVTETVNLPKSWYASTHWPTCMSEDEPGGGKRSSQRKRAARCHNFEIHIDREAEVIEVEGLAKEASGGPWTICNNDDSEDPHFCKSIKWARFSGRPDIDVREERIQQ